MSFSWRPRGRRRRCLYSFLPVSCSLSLSLITKKRANHTVLILNRDHDQKEDVVAALGLDSHVQLLDPEVEPPGDALSDAAPDRVESGAEGAAVVCGGRSRRGERGLRKRDDFPPFFSVFVFFAS